MLISALLGALGSVSVMAQGTNVYSLNAVGYINVTCAPGYSIIADQLIATNNSIGSLLNNVVPNSAPGPYEGVQVYSWNGSGFVFDTGDNQLSGTATGWDNNGVITMNPGQAVFIHNPRTTNLVVTFVGTVPQGSLTNTITGPNHFSMLSSQVPQAGDLVTNLGLTNYNDGDQVYVYNNNPPAAAGYTLYGVDKVLGGAGYLGQWDPPGDPTVAVGQGFWYHTSGTGVTFNWVRNFNPL